VARFRFEPYVEFAKKAFSREATYRMEVLSNVGGVLVRLFIMKSVWTALYAQNVAPAGVSLGAIITYTAVALLMSIILEIDGTRLIQTRVREGTIATDLMKPINLVLFFFSDGVGQTLLHAILIVPALCLALFLVHIDVPPPPVLAAFALSFLLGYVVNFLLNFTMNAVAFWTLETFAIQLMVRWVSDLLGGQIVPLIFFPPGLQNVVLALPFAAIYSTPLLIYLGNIPPAEYAAALGLQALWALVFAAVSAVIWRAAQRHIVIQGG
jgi:ABC-2 type transport system permease protein